MALVYLTVCQDIKHTIIHDVNILQESNNQRIYKFQVNKKIIKFLYFYFNYLGFSVLWLNPQSFNVCKNRNPETFVVCNFFGDFRCSS